MDDGKEHLMKDVNLEHIYCVQAAPVDGPDIVAALLSTRVASRTGTSCGYTQLLLRVIKTYLNRGSDHKL